MNRRIRSAAMISLILLPLSSMAQTARLHVVAAQAQQISAPKRSVPKQLFELSGEGVFAAIACSAAAVKLGIDDFLLRTVGRIYYLRRPKGAYKDALKSTLKVNKDDAFGPESDCADRKYIVHATWRETFRKTKPQLKKNQSQHSRKDSSKVNSSQNRD